MTAVLQVPAHDADKCAKRPYMWNAAVAAAYMPSIAMVEVLVRNAMNTKICEHFTISPTVGWHTLVDCGDSTPPPWEGECYL